jgi:hypothetical protein
MNIKKKDQTLTEILGIRGQCGKLGNFLPFFSFEYTLWQ